MSAHEALGFEPVPAANLRRRDGIFAGSDAERLAGFHRLAADPTVAAIAFARGGAGTLRILPGIDWRLLGQRPRAYVGYSDLTPFLLAVVARLGLAAFHGPMVATDLARGLGPIEKASWLGALAGRYPVRMRLRAVTPAASPRPREVGSGGDSPVARGPLLGGCLSLLAATLGTPCAPDLAGAILFWEDVGEPWYRLDRMLTQLRLSGSLAAIRGMVVGRVELADEQPRTASLARLLGEQAASLRVPVARGLPSGHAAPNLTIPLGLPARLAMGGGRAELEVGVGAGRAG
jgi:muramoyltetrapeptide carboxypeptidase